MGNVTNRVFDSSGPDGKVRGTPQQIIDKYLLLARDAQLSNDRVVAEGFLQHAEHYTRLLGEAQREMEARRGEGGDWSGGQDGEQPNGQAPGHERQADQGGRPHNERGQNDQNQRDRNQRDRPRNGRGQDDRDPRQTSPNRHGDQSGPDRDRNFAQSDDSGGAERAKAGPATSPDRGRGTRSSFDDVIDLQDAGAGESDLIETPEARQPTGPRPDDNANAASEKQPDTGSDTGPDDPPAKPVRRRSGGPRRPRKTAEGKSGDADSSNSPDQASAAE